MTDTPGCGLIINADGTTNSTRGVTHTEIRTGYAYIIDTMNRAFDFPIDFFASQTPDRKWDKSWEFAPDGEKFSSTYSDADSESTHAHVVSAYKKWTILMKENRNIGTTPAYDVVAIRYALDAMRDTTDERFDILSISTSPSRTIQEVVLRPSVRDKGLAALFV